MQTCLLAQSSILCPDLHLLDMETYERSILHDVSLGGVPSLVDARAGVSPGWGSHPSLDTAVGSLLSLAGILGGSPPLAGGDPRFKRLVSSDCDTRLRGTKPKAMPDSRRVSECCKTT